MYAFYVTRGGYTLNDLSSVSFIEKSFLRHAMAQYYKEENQKLRALTGGGGE